jgi:uncharacterized membrane protein YphA (DoxX/SURF4 family)
MEYIGLVARLVIGLVFLVAGATKLRDPVGFRAAVSNYRILPERLVTPVARALPALEVLVGVMLVLGILIVPTAVVAALVLVAFAGAIWVNVRRERHIGCGCGFAGRQEVSKRLVVRNGVLAATALSAAAWPSAALALWPGPAVPESTLTPADAFAAVVGTAAATALVVLVLAVHRFLVRRGSSLLRAAASA